MSVASALRTIQQHAARHLNARAEVLRTIEYDTLEKNRVGRGIFHSGNRNPSSKPGDPPARQTGRLQESIAVTERAKPRKLVATVGPRPQAFRDTAPYPVFLEFGTRHIAPRPFVRPSASELKRTVR